MKNDILDRLLLLFEKYSQSDGANPDGNSQMCLFWSTASPPDVLEGTKQLETIEAEFDVDIYESEAVEMYDMDLQEASEYIRMLLTSKLAPK